MTTETFSKDVCSAKHSFALDNLFRRFFQKPEKIVGPYISKGDTIIDIGCGPGFFTIDMARLTGKTGQVIGVDLQKEMLAKVRKKALKHHLENTIVLHQCPQDELGLAHEIKADFILAYYMVHETPDPKQFLAQVRPHLKPTGRLLIVEPVFHVSSKKFKQYTIYAEQTGFQIIDRPARKGGRSLVLGVN